MGYGKPLKITQALNAAKNAAKKLKKESRIGLVTFDTTAEVLIEPQPLNLKIFEKELEEITLKGVSCIASGFEASIDLALKSSGDERSILLLTDGRANLSLDHMGGYEGSLELEAELIKIAEDAARENIRVDTVSIGEDAFIGMLEAVALKSGGEHFIVEDYLKDSKSSLPVIEARKLRVHSVPSELPSACPSWTKESQFLHVSVVSHNLFEKYEKNRRSFIINPANKRKARTSLMSIDSEKLEEYTKRRPKTAAAVREERSILLDKSCRDHLELNKKDRAELRIY